MALKFVGGTPYVVLGRVPEIEAAHEFTLAAWVRVDDVGSDAAIAARGTAFDGSAAWVLYRDEVAYVSGRSNTIAAQVNSDVGLLRVESAANALNDTSWHHVALVFKANTAGGLRLYVDGLLDPNSASTIGHSSVVSDTTDVHLGFNSASVQLLGAMAEVGIWSAALAANEVALLASGFSPLALPAAVDGLAVYHDAIRGLNRPGIGPPATSGGTFAHAAHPRTLRPHRALAHVSPAQSLVVGPHRSESGDLAVAGGEAGEVFVSGADAGALSPTGEVYS